MSRWDLKKLRCLFGFFSTEYDRHDIMDLAINTKIPLSVNPRAVPINPTLPMRPRNVAIVRLEDLTFASNLYSLTCSVSAYILFVQACNLVPENADAGVPWDPYCDKEYRRVDIDVVPILQDEQSRPRERPVLDAMLDATQGQLLGST